jgi:hypothetical protein
MKGINMHKNLITICTALAMLAATVVGPSAAFATNTPLLTAPAGTVAVAGSTIVGTAGETILANTNGEPILTCSNAKMSGEVTKNFGGNVEGNITSAAIFGPNTPVAGEPNNACVAILDFSVTATTPWCLRSTTVMATDAFSLRGGKCSEAAKPIVFHLVFSNTTCTYERTTISGPITGTFTTGTSPASLTVSSTPAGSGFVKTAGSSFICPSSGVLKMTFTLENGSGQAAVIDG